MFKKIAVVGAGGTGSVIGGLVTKAGHDLVFIDQWPEHVAAMKKNGLHMAIGEEEFQVPVQAFHIHEVSTLNLDLDLVFLACKAYDVRWMIELIKPYLRDNGVLIPAQNGLTDEWIAPLIGYTRDIGCVITMSSEVFQPGRVVRNTPKETPCFTLGELNGLITPRLQELQQILNAAGKTEITNNIWGKKWFKLVYNSIVAPVCALAGVPLAELTDAPERLPVSIKLGKETLQVGQALGYAMEEVFELKMGEMFTSPESLVENFVRASANVGRRCRVWFHQDVLKGRRTEVDYINGLVSQKGKEVGIPTPMNDAATMLMKRLERGELKPNAVNIRYLTPYV